MRRAARGRSAVLSDREIVSESPTIGRDHRPLRAISRVPYLALTPFFPVTVSTASAGKFTVPAWNDMDTAVGMRTEYVHVLRLPFSVQAPSEAVETMCGTSTANRCGDRADASMRGDKSIS